MQESTLTQFKSGSLSPQEATASINTAFNVSSGLISPETFDLISEVSAEIPKDSQRRRRLFLSVTGGLIEIDFVYGDFKVIVKRRGHADNNGWTETKVMDCSDNEVPYRAAKALIEKCAAALISKGFRELP